jgi:hypothetical protein
LVIARGDATTNHLWWTGGPVIAISEGEEMIGCITKQSEGV